MKKLIAVICVVSWAGFWAFGYLALSAQDFDSGQVMLAALLAFVGMVSGVFAYMWLARTYPDDYRRATPSA
jgi:hypothetical protein